MNHSFVFFRKSAVFEKNSLGGKNHEMLITQKKSRPVKDDSMNGPEKSLSFCFLSLFVSVVAQDNTVAGVFCTFDCDGDFADA